MDSRSIDSAKTATIDMMALNNKVVNMRQVVKRTKVHVINKLAKHIKALKKKKGSDEQRAKNLRKADRFIEEIDSVKKLKDDKVSKYALANTGTFDEVSKISTLAGPRALARLADHPLMKKVVAEFREQHSDWRDLAAYLLVKQTGRRFKTKKQKQKKHSKTVENINASEVMTKAYIQERFGEEGLAKAEERFERKRKRGKLAPKSEDDTNVNENTEIKKQKIELEKGAEELVNENNEKEAVKKHDSEIVRSATNTEKSEDFSKTVGVKTSEDEKVHLKEIQMKSAAKLAAINKDSDNFSMNKSEDKEVELSSTVLSDHEDDSESSSEGNSGTEVFKSKGQIEDNEITHDDEKSASKQTKKNKSECVIKKLKIAESDSESELSEGDDDSEDDSESSKEVSSDTDRLESKSQIESDDSADSESDSSPTSKISKKLKKQIPEFLTKPAKMNSDPFFAGSDDDDGEHDEIVEEVEKGIVEDLFDNPSDGDYGFRKNKIESMFYNPHSSDMSEGDNWSKKNFSRGSFRARGAPGHRGRAPFRGQGEWRGRGRGGNLRDTRRGGRGRGGSSWGGDDRNFRSERRVGHTQNTHVKRFGADNTDSVARDSFKPSKEDHRKGEPKSEEKLHPSWEASKKRKAEQSGIVAFKGSKMTFDDND